MIAFRLTFDAVVAATTVAERVLEDRLDVQLVGPAPAVDVAAGRSRHHLLDVAESLANSMSKPLPAAVTLTMLPTTLMSVKAAVNAACKVFEQSSPVADVNGSGFVSWKSS